MYIICQYSSRSAGIKIRTPGGEIAIVTAYAPHVGRPFKDKFEFFSKILQNTSKAFQ